MTDAEAVARVLAGETEAFAVLVERHQRAVYNLAYRLLGDPHEAEDAAQEAFLRAYQHLRRYDRSRPFDRWLLAIAAHLCLDWLRRRRLRRWLPLLPGRPDPRRGPEGEALANLEAERLQRCLGRLAPEDRLALILKYWYGWSAAEIGRVLGVAAGTARVRLHRARRRLEVLWSEEEETGVVRGSTPPAAAGGPAVAGGAAHPEGAGAEPD